MIIGIILGKSILVINLNEKNLMDVIYYYYYLFYKKIIKDSEPHLLTIIALSATEGFFLNIILEIILIFYKCTQTNGIIWMGIICLANLFNYFYFYKSKRAIKIVKEKPKFFSSNKISILLTFLFFIFFSASIIWGSILTKFLLKTYCN
ncbi:hypothetical protein ASE21_07515 [Flavobacterium sp. Root901]|nr:hypothetical protein ASE21_07515 [Flavobacterium sp. Root901]